MLSEAITEKFYEVQRIIISMALKDDKLRITIGIVIVIILIWLATKIIPAIKEHQAYIKGYQP